jgi:hypothetical protein
VPIEFYTHDPEHLAVPKRGVGIFLIDANLSSSAMTAIVQAARGLRPAPLVVFCGPSQSRRPSGGRHHSPSGRCRRRSTSDGSLHPCNTAEAGADRGRLLDAAEHRQEFRLEVEESSDGPSALQQVRARRFGLVFVDYNKG